MQKSGNSVLKSEIMDLIAEFEAQHQAATRGLYGFAEVGKHEIITAHMERMGEIIEELEEHVGKQEATEIAVNVMEGKKIVQ